MNELLDEPTADLRRRMLEAVHGQLVVFDDVIERTRRVPDEAVQALRRLGYYGLNTPRSFGGCGYSMLETAVCIEVLGHAHIALYYHSGVNVHIGSKPIESAASEALQRRWLPAIASGEVVAAFALTEAEAGSDAKAVRTTATPVEGGFRLDGRKRYITNAPIAGVFTVIARCGDAIDAFVVEAGSPGLHVREPEALLGGHGSYHAEVDFDGVVVPADNRIGQAGSGFSTALRSLDAGRLLWAAYAVGAATRAFGVALEHLETRRQFGRPLIDNQGLSWRAADAAAQLYACRAAVYAAARAYDGRPSGRRVRGAAAKLVATELAFRIVDECMQFMGGLGYSTRSPIERIWRDLRVARILDGTSEILRSVIARDLRDISGLT